MAFTANLNVPIFFFKFFFSSCIHIFTCRVSIGVCNPTSGAKIELSLHLNPSNISLNLATLSRNFGVQTSVWVFETTSQCWWIHSRVSRGLPSLRIKHGHYWRTESNFIVASFYIQRNTWGENLPPVDVHDWHSSFLYNVNVPGHHCQDLIGNQWAVSVSKGRQFLNWVL